MNALLAILNVFIDPAETARLIRGNKLAWVAPVVLGGGLMAIYQLMVAPLTMQAMRNDPPPGMDAAKLDAMKGAMETMSRFSAITAPMMYAVMTLLGAALIFAVCVILLVNVRFPDVFNLMAHVGLINAVQMMAHLLVLREKGELTSVKEITPSFGLEMFLADGTSK